jgi:hypothetical protein
MWDEAREYRLSYVSDLMARALVGGEGHVGDGAAAVQAAYGGTPYFAVVADLANHDAPVADILTVVEGVAA